MKRIPDNLRRGLTLAALFGVSAVVYAAAETSQALLFVDVFQRTASRAAPVFWRGKASSEALHALADHALDTIRQRMARGSPQPSAQFVTTTRNRQLLRVQMAAVIDLPGPVLGGFVLMLDNVTREFEQESLPDQLLHGMTEGSRGALANLPAAVEMLAYPDLDAAMHARFLGVVREETAALSQRVQNLAHSAASGLKTCWPMEDMRGSDLVAAIARRIEALGTLEVRADAVDATLWLRVDSFSLMQALACLAARLADEFGIGLVELRLSIADTRAHLDQVRAGQVMNTETVMGWEMDPMRIGTDTTPLSVRDVVDRHGGAFWFERERVRHEALLRFLLQLAAAQQTTGLDPSAVDEIIQIGATRIVNGRLLRHEGFEQLVDLQRAISAASIPIHGIENAMVAGQPTIDQVLPAVVRPHQESHALEAIAQRLDIAVEGRHTALGDATVTAQGFLKLLPLLADKGIHTLGQARAAARETDLARVTY